MYEKLFALLIACTGCPIEKIEYKFDKNYMFCGDYGDVVRESISKHYWEYIEGDPFSHGYYTEDGKLFIGVYCE